MAYIKYKEISKYFNFSKAIDLSVIPKYIKDYISKNETILSCYKTMRDHGVFTDKKILLFDKKMSFDSSREIFTIPYNTISTISVIFKPTSAELSLFLESGYPLRLKFVHMSGLDKVRLRLIYSVIQHYIIGEEPAKDTINRLVNNELDYN